MDKISKRCGNCGSGITFVKHEKLQLGRTSLVFGDWPNLLAGALEVEIWYCPKCGKIDFYRGEPGTEYESGHIAQTVCPTCGVKHDLDDPKCPYCGAKNPNM